MSAWRIALLASIGIHTTALGVCACLLLSENLPGEIRVASSEVAVELTPGTHCVDASSGSTGNARILRSRPAKIALSEPGRRGAEPRPDTRHPGRGGTNLARLRALNLSDTIDQITLSRDPFDSLAPGQLPRAKTAAFRRSPDDWTSDPRPIELTLGSNTMPPPANDRREAEEPRLPGGRVVGPPGSEAPMPVGELDGSSSAVPGPDEPGRLQARVTIVRPWMSPGRPAVSTRIPGPPSDSTSSTQRVSSLVESLVHASSAGGRLGNGPGGQNGSGPPGYGGTVGPGSVSTPQGSGIGTDPGQDLRTIPYVGQALRKVDWRDAFPRWAIARGLSGLATIGLVVLRDGRVAEARIVRPSGIPEYDRNLLEAVRRAAPYGPLPPELAARPLAMQMSFDAINPAVGRAGPGPGQRRPKLEPPGLKQPGQRPQRSAEESPGPERR